MQITLTKIKEKQELKVMMLSYFKEVDNSKISKNHPAELNYPYFDLYWIEPNRIPYKIIFNNEVVGFALINDYVLNKPFNADKSIAELHIKPAYRRLGIGKITVYQLFDKYKGKWEVRQNPTNYKAQHFWRIIIGKYMNGNYLEGKRRYIGHAIIHNLIVHLSPNHF